MWDTILHFLQNFTCDPLIKSIENSPFVKRVTPPLLLKANYLFLAI
jgi:hypothetical protein